MRIWKPYIPPSIQDVKVEQLITALNAQRAKHSLPALVSSNELMGVSQAWAAQMAGENSMYHGNFSGRLNQVFPNTAAGENIAEGQPTVDAVVSCWMWSLPHRFNILGNYNLIGIGIATADNGSIYWCVDFAKKD